MRDSMVLYRSFAEAMDELPAEQYKETMQAITRYAMDGIEPECNGVVRAIFLMAKPQIDANNKRYENGKRGGRPKATNTEPTNNQTKTKTKPRRAKAKPNVNVNVNVNENVNVNDTVSKETVGKSDFERLWEEYPNKKGKKDAERHYRAAVKDGTTFDEVMDGIKAYKNYITTLGTEPQYVKHGSAFFCQRAWESDWSVPKVNTEAKGKSNVYIPEPPKYKEFEPEPDIDGVPMPDEIRKKFGKTVEDMSL